ncbi:MAG: hypothetical protein ACLPGW_17775 [Roseiarcus sp.]
MTEEKAAPKPRPKRERRRSLKAAQIAAFLRLYGRTAQKGGDPNDRHYDREFESRVKQMDPVELDRLIREDEE